MKREEGFEVIIPQSKEKAKRVSDEVGGLQMQEERIKQRLKKRIAELETKAAEEIDTLRQKMISHLASLYGFYQKNWEELTEEGKRKIIDISFGEFGIYETKPWPRIKNVKKVLQLLKIRKLKQCIRFIPAREEINKEAVLANQKAVADIKEIRIVKKEKFKVIPKKTGIPLAEDIKKLKRFLP